VPSAGATVCPLVATAKLNNISKTWAFANVHQTASPQLNGKVER
jgi:hypothetical protein